MIFLAIIIFFLAIILFWQSIRLSKKSGLPGGKLIYADTNQWESSGSPLFDKELGITGKPDYIFKDKKHMIPVEVKSGKIRSEPTESHIFQLAAYCFLIEKAFNQKPPFGIIHYIPNHGEIQENQTKTFRIDYSNHLESRFLSTIEKIRILEKEKEVPRSHQMRARCERCGYHNICDQKL